MANNDYDYEVTDSWSEMLDHFNTTIWPEFQTRGFDEAGKTKILELFLINRMYNMLDIHIDNLIEKLMLVNDALRGR